MKPYLPNELSTQGGPRSTQSISKTSQG